MQEKGERKRRTKSIVACCELQLQICELLQGEFNSIVCKVLASAPNSCETNSCEKRQMEFNSCETNEIEFKHSCEIEKKLLNNTQKRKSNVSSAL